MQARKSHSNTSLRIKRQLTRKNQAYIEPSLIITGRTYIHTRLNVASENKEKPINETNQFFNFETGTQLDCSTAFRGRVATLSVLECIDSTTSNESRKQQLD